MTGGADGRPRLAAIDSAARSRVDDGRRAKINWLINIIIFQLLLGQALSELSCLKTEKCSCQKYIGKDQIEVTCDSSTMKANLEDSIVEIHCHSNKIQWEQSFGQINITKFCFKNCSIDSEIYNLFSTLGINIVQEIKLSSIKLNGSLEKLYLSNFKSVTQLDITDTKPPLTLTSESFEGTPYLTRLYLRRNLIKELPVDVFKHLTYLAVLDLGENHISIIDTNLFNSVPLKGLVLDSNHLTTLNLNIPTLKHLDVSNNKLTSITVGDLKNLVDISLNKNTLVTMPDQPFNNSSLELIRFNFGSFTSIPKQFLSGLHKLQTVYLKYLNLDMLPEDTIWNSPNITELSLASNRLKGLPVSFFRDSKKMKKLDLSNNEFKLIDSELLKPLTKLENLNLSNNLILQINNYGLRNLKNLINLNLENNYLSLIEREALNVPKLKMLKLARNKLRKLSSNYTFLFHYLNEIEEIDLSNNGLTSIDGGWINLLRLKKINLANNNFTNLEVGDIQFFNEGIYIDLNSNPLEFFNLTTLVMHVKAQPTFNTLNTAMSITPRHISLSGNKFICDCRNYEFVMYLHNKMPKNVYKYLEINQNLICSNSTHFENINLDSLTCDWNVINDVDKIDCPDCVCTYRPYDRSATMDCSNKNLISAPSKVISSKNIDYIVVILKNNSITTLPNYEHYNIRKLDIGHNYLSSINITQLPKNLMELYLEHNNLSTINYINLNNTLNNLSLLTLSGNPWTCNSKAKNTFNFIKKYSQKVIDLDNLKCSDSTSLQYNLNKEFEENDEFQKFKIMVGTVSLVVFCLLLILLWALYYGYKLKIKIWLYSHNITWPISEESLDKDKIYDAFISFSHKDLDFIENELVPGLEGGNTPFKLCLHYRDWTVGDYIPTQIARSVDESRRTIIVLSQNFLESIWAGTEFRTAYVSALKEGRTRIIVILYGHVSTDNLDPELEAYLSMNTYIEWGDRWFWKKLRYALPHRRENKIRTKPIIPDKLNPLQLNV